MQHTTTMPDHPAPEGTLPTGSTCKGARVPGYVHVNPDGTLHCNYCGHTTTDHPFQVGDLVVRDRASEFTNQPPVGTVVAITDVSDGRRHLVDVSYPLDPKDLATRTGQHTWIERDRPARQFASRLDHLVGLIHSTVNGYVLGTGWGAPGILDGVNRLGDIAQHLGLDDVADALMSLALEYDLDLDRDEPTMTLETVCGSLRRIAADATTGTTR